MLEGGLEDGGEVEVDGRDVGEAVVFRGVSCENNDGEMNLKKGDGMFQIQN